MDSKLIELAMETMKLALMVSMPMLLAGLIAGLAVSIFQATTQINEMTLTFLPKLLLTGLVLILTLPWITHQMVEFTVRLFKMIPNFLF